MLVVETLVSLAITCTAMDVCLFLFWGHEKVSAVLRIVGDWRIRRYVSYCGNRSWIGSAATDVETKILLKDVWSNGTRHRRIQNIALSVLYKRWIDEALGNVCVKGTVSRVSGTSPLGIGEPALHRQEISQIIVLDQRSGHGGQARDL